MVQSEAFPLCERLVRNTSVSHRPLLICPYAKNQSVLLWRPFLLGVAAVPSVYVLVYITLRLCGVYHLFYNQGGWEIDGGNGVYIVDVTFLPATIMEADCQNRLRWLREPGGG